MTNTWLDKNQLPPFKRLKIQFDPIKLRDELQHLMSDRGFDAYDNEYKELFHGNASSDTERAHNKNMVNIKDQFNTLPLTVFDEDFDLSQRVEMSNSIWDRRVAKNSTKLDERFYRKPVDGIPEHTASVMAAFAPFVHRTRYTKLNSGQSISEHVDYDTKYSVRLMMAIDTNDKCLNSWRMPDGRIETVHIPADGSIWFINQGLPHWADNPGDSDRVHLILSVDSQSVLDM
jgi:Aspartyl/Asparaginyl beta-hydroxylase